MVRPSRLSHLKLLSTKTSNGWRTKGLRSGVVKGLRPVVLGTPVIEPSPFLKSPRNKGTKNFNK